VHCGFEGSALDRTLHEPAAFWQVAAWSLFHR
jgi:hypothetical protein